MSVSWRLAFGGLSSGDEPPFGHARHFPRAFRSRALSLTWRCFVLPCMTWLSSWLLFKELPLTFAPGDRVAVCRCPHMYRRINSREARNNHNVWQTMEQRVRPSNLNPTVSKPNVITWPDDHLVYPALLISKTSHCWARVKNDCKYANGWAAMTATFTNSQDHKGSCVPRITQGSLWIFVLPSSLLKNINFMLI